MLDHVFLDNTVKAWLNVSGVVFVTLLLNRYLSRYIASQLHKWVVRWSGNIDRTVFKDFVVGPLGWFLLLSIAVFALDKLRFPTDLDVEVYGLTTKDLFNRLGKGIIVTSFFWLLLRFVDFVATVLNDKAQLQTDIRENQLIVFFRDFLKVVIGILGVLVIVKVCFNQPIGNVLTGLSIVGAALALAAKESMENLIASFVIFFNRPFFTGDLVKTSSVTGTVELIGLRSTRIRTADTTLVTVPNKQMVDGIVDNWSMRKKRRGEMLLQLDTKTTAAQMKHLLEDIRQLLSTEQNPLITQADVHFREFSKEGQLIAAEFFTEPIPMTEFWKLKESIHLAIREQIETRGVDFAGEENTIRVKGEEQS